MSINKAVALTSLQNLEANTLCANDSDFECDLEIEDEEDERQRRERDKTLKSQEFLSKGCSGRSRNTFSLKDIDFFEKRQEHAAFQSHFQTYFSKFSNSTSITTNINNNKNIASNQRKLVQSAHILEFYHENQEGDGEQEQEDDDKYHDSSLEDESDDFSPAKAKGCPNFMNIRLATMKNEFNNENDSVNQQEDKFNENENCKNNKEYKIQLTSTDTAAQISSTPFDIDTPFDFINFEEGSKNNKDNCQFSAYLQQQRFLENQQKQSLEQQKDEQIVSIEKNQIQLHIHKEQQSFQEQIPKKVENESQEGSMSQKQQEYFGSSQFRQLIESQIVPLITIPNRKYVIERDTFFILIPDNKLTRVYLKNIGCYIQIRLFEKESCLNKYLMQYDKVKQLFTNLLPLTILTSFSSENVIVLCQRLGELSLRDLSNIILVEQKHHKQISYQKYFQQALYSLFSSLIFILNNHYYVGNITSSNVFLSNSKGRYTPVFTSLVDFSVPYSSIANPNFMFSKDHRNEQTQFECMKLFDLLFKRMHAIWYNELYACCRCLQQMIERDPYTLEKKNIKDFILKHKEKQPSLIVILEKFLCKNEFIVEGGDLSVDAIEQFVNSQFCEEKNTKRLSISDKSANHISLMIASSHIYLNSKQIDLNTRIGQQRAFFFVQQFRYHQDWDDYTAKRALRFLISSLFRKISTQNIESLNLQPNNSKQKIDASSKKEEENNKRLCLKANSQKKISESDKVETDVLWLVVDEMVADIQVFRKDKHLQKASYGIYIIFCLLSEKRFAKGQTYWKYLSSMTSLVEQQQNPITLYFVGMFNFYLLEHSKSTKYFELSSQNASYSQDLISISQAIPPQENGIIKQNNSENSINYLEDIKDQAQNYDKDEISIRAGYSYLSKFRVEFNKETTVKKLQNVFESLSKTQLKSVKRVVEIEFMIMKNFASQLASSSKCWFIEQLQQENNFNNNQFYDSVKFSNLMNNLISNIKASIPSTTERFLKQMIQLFSAQNQLQLLIGETIACSKGIINKVKCQHAKTFANLEQIN